MSPTQMRITRRQATPDDREFARTVHHAAYRQVVMKQFGQWNQAEQDGFFATAWNPNATEVLLADKAPCGYLVVEERPADVHVREIVVHPDWQGQGVGTTILRAIQARAAQRKTPVVLGTFHVNPARRLYERLGFVQVGATETSVLMRWSPPGSAASMSAGE